MQVVGHSMKTDRLQDLIRLQVFALSLAIFCSRDRAGEILARDSIAQSWILLEIKVATLIKKGKISKEIA